MVDGGVRQLELENGNGLAETLMGKVESSSKREKTMVGKDLSAERKDPLEFITT